MALWTKEERRDYADSKNLSYVDYKRVPVNPALAALYFERAFEKKHEKAGQALREMIPENERTGHASACPAVLSGLSFHKNIIL